MLLIVWDILFVVVGHPCCRVAHACRCVGHAFHCGGHAFYRGGHAVYHFKAYIGYKISHEKKTIYQRISHHWRCISGPELLKANSGMFETGKGRKVHQVLTANRTMVGTLPVLRAFAGDNNDYVSPYVFFDEFGPVKLDPRNKPLRVDAHPHAGIIPTTYFLSGSGHHKDSLTMISRLAKATS